MSAVCSGLNCKSDAMFESNCANKERLCKECFTKHFLWCGCGCIDITVEVQNKINIYKDFCRAIFNGQRTWESLKDPMCDYINKKINTEIENLERSKQVADEWKLGRTADINQINIGTPSDEFFENFKLRIDTLFRPVEESKIEAEVSGI